MSEGLSSPDNSKETFEDVVRGFTPSWEKEDDDISVPPQCEFCPRVTAIREDLDDLRNSAKCLAIAAMGDKVMILTDEKAIDGDKVAECLRELAIEKFNEWEEETKIAKEEIARSTDKCKGPLALKGSDDSQDVCVVICNSPKMSKSDSGKPQIGEPVIIKRKKKNED